VPGVVVDTTHGEAGFGGGDADLINDGGLVGEAVHASESAGVIYYQEGHPTIAATNRGLPDWGTIFGDTVVAAAVLERLMHNAIVFNIRGPSPAPTRTPQPRDRYHQPRRTHPQLTSPTDRPEQRISMMAGALGFDVGWRQFRLGPVLGQYARRYRVFAQVACTRGVVLRGE
jgi:IstB-like ATP binding protein